MTSPPPPPAPLAISILVEGLGEGGRAVRAVSERGSGRVGSGCERWSGAVSERGSGRVGSGCKGRAGVSQRAGEPGVGGCGVGKRSRGGDGEGGLHGQRCGDGEGGLDDGSGDGDGGSCLDGEGGGLLADDSVESVEWVGGVVDDAAGAVSLEEGVLALDDIAVAGLALGLEVAGDGVGHVVAVGVLWVGVVLGVGHLGDHGLGDRGCHGHGGGGQESGVGDGHEGGEGDELKGDEMSLVFFC